MEDFLRHAVLVYGPDDGPDRWQQAREILAANPELPAQSLHAAAAVSDPVEVARQLAADPAGANREGGPLGWPPLLYLTYSRVRPDASVEETVAAARLLISAGADPNAGFLWEGDPPPFTALTGVFGDGEQGSLQQPPHPHAAALARVLLEAGADANDGQTLYNRMFSAADDHLELLFEHGLGAGDGGPWHRRLPDRTDSPPQLVRAQLSWAIVHGLSERIHLLARHGVDLAEPLEVLGPLRSSLTPVQLAMHSGQAEVVRLLVELGAPDTAAGEDRLLAALLAGDGPEVDRLAGADPALLERVRRTHPSLILRAAVVDNSDAVRLLAGHGWSLDALGRQDLPIEQPWETALHHAAGEGNLELVGLLLELGADPAVRDRRFSSTALVWAQHFGWADVAALLESVTPRGE